MSKILNTINKYGRLVYDTENSTYKLDKNNSNVFCNREVHSYATKNTQCCHPIVSV